MDDDTMQNNMMEEEEEEEAFIDLQDAVEVKVEDGDEPMEEEEDMMGASNSNNNTNEAEDVVDMSVRQYRNHAGPLYAVAACQDATSNNLWIATGGGDDRAWLHNTSIGSAEHSVELGSKRTDSVSSIAWSFPLVAVGAYDGTIEVYQVDATTGQQLPQPITKLEGPTDVEWLSFHPKGGTVLLAGSVSDGTVWMYHVPTSKCMQVFVGHEGAVNAGSFSMDGKWAVSAGADGTLRVWAPKTGLSRHVFRLSGADAHNTNNNSNNNGPAGGLTCLALRDQDNVCLVGSESGMAYLCHLGTKKVVATLVHSTPSSTTNNNNMGEEEGEEGDAISVEAVGFAMPAVNPNWCATGGVDGALKIWDLGHSNSAGGQCRQTCRVPSEDGTGSSVSGSGITRLQWHPTLPVVLCAYADGTIRVWDARNAALLQTLTGHSDMINDMDFAVVAGAGGNNDNNVAVVSASDDQTARVFELNLSTLLQQPQTAMRT
eukprot:scaffold38938_cov59-Attheya_sp.AAC.2